MLTILTSWTRGILHIFDINALWPACLGQFRALGRSHSFGFWPRSGNRLDEFNLGNLGGWAGHQLGTWERWKMQGTEASFSSWLFHYHTRIYNMYKNRCGLLSIVSSRWAAVVLFRLLEELFATPSLDKVWRLGHLTGAGLGAFQGLLGERYKCSLAGGGGPRMESIYEYLCIWGFVLATRVDFLTIYIALYCSPLFELAKSDLVNAMTSARSNQSGAALFYSRLTGVRVTHYDLYKPVWETRSCKI